MSADTNSEHNGIVAQAYDHVADDTKFIRLTTITTFIHSMVFLIYIMYTAYSLILSNSGGDLPVDSIF